MVTLFTHQRVSEATDAGQRTAPYDKAHPTLSDAVALVRRELWTQEQAIFSGSSGETDPLKIPREFMERLTETVCYAA